MIPIPRSRSYLTLLVWLAALLAPEGARGQEVTIEGTQFKAFGQPIWLNGINAAWIDWNDFGGGRFRAFQTNPNDRATRGWDEEIASYAAAGINCARVWIDCDGTHVLKWDAAGNVTGYVDGFVTDVGRLLDIGQKYGVYIMPVLTSFDHARAKDWTTEDEQWRVLLGDDAKIDSYLNTVVIPLVQAYPHHPYLLAWEICNEPEWMYAGSTEQRGTTKERVIMFHARVAAAIHQHSPKPVTTGAAGWQWMSNRAGYNGQLYSDASLQAAFNSPDARLDFYQIHYYGWMQSQGATPFDSGRDPAYFLQAAPDRPVIVGECPGLAIPTGGALKTVVQEYEAGKANGYQGVLAWSSSGHDGAGTLPEIAVATARMQRRYTAEISPARPRFTLQPAATTVAAGGSVTLRGAVAGEGPVTYRWTKDGSPLAGTTASLTLSAVGPADAGRYQLIATGPGGAETASRAAELNVASVASGKLSNLSFLADSGNGADVLTAGFVTSGGSAANVVVRGVAQQLAKPPFNVGGTLADPVLIARKLDGTELARNDNWSVSAQAAMKALGAFDLDAGNGDAVFAGSLPADTPISIEVNDAGGGTGIAIAEIYDANPLLTGNRLVNLSARVRASSLSAGFVITGNVPHEMLIRGIGPALATWLDGYLADPRLRLVNTGTGQVVATNEDWGDFGVAEPLRAAMTTSGAFPFPTDSLDAALLITLPPGTYSVVIDDANGGSGIAMAEVYDLGER